MKEIIMHKPQKETIVFEKVNPYAPIFAKLEGNLAGMIVKEKNGWILRLGRASAATGHHCALLDCIESCVPYGYVFFTDYDMKEIIIHKPQEETIDFGKVNLHMPIFAERNKKLVGMVVKDDAGWCLRLGRNKIATGYHKTPAECIESCILYGYVFIVN